MFSDQFYRVKETMCTAANMIPLIAPDDCGHSLLADTRVSDHYDPAWLCTRATCGALLHGIVQFYQIASGIYNPNFAFLTKIIVGHCLINPRVGLRLISINCDVDALHFPALALSVRLNMSEPNNGQALSSSHDGRPLFARCLQGLLLRQAAWRSRADSLVCSDIAAWNCAK